MDNAYSTATCRAALARLCQQHTQAAVAQRLGLSEATVSQYLAGTYKANSHRIDRHVAGELLGATCSCPVLGEVSTHLCQAVQERTRGEIGNPQYARTWYACRGQGAFTRAGRCPHFTYGGAKPTATPPEEAL